MSREHRSLAAVGIAIVAVTLALVAAAASAEGENATPAPAAAGSAGPYSLLLSPDGSRLFVTDVERRRLAVYLVNGNKLDLGDVRQLDQDLTGAAARPAPKKPEPPSKDLPGQDPPEFRRPARSVRTRSEVDAARGKWSVTYLVPGAWDEVWTATRKSLDGWRLRSEHVQRGQSYPASAELERDNATLGVSIQTSAAPEGWVELHVNQENRR